MALVETTGWNAAQMRVLRALHGMGPEVMLAALDSVGDAIVGQYKKNIAEGRAPRDGKFVPLSPRGYAAWKAEHFPGKPILVRTGAMLGSLAYRSSMVGPGHYRLECGAGGVDKDGVRNGVKALAHIDGGKNWANAQKRAADAKAQAAAAKASGNKSMAKYHAKVAKVWRGHQASGLPKRDFGQTRRNLLTAAFARALRAAMQRASVPQSR
jgi:hypothetical protein